LSIGRRFKISELAAETTMKSETKTGEDFYRKELAAEFARNQALEQQIERLLAELARVKGELAAVSPDGKGAPAGPLDTTPRVAASPIAAAAAPPPPAPAREKPTVRATAGTAVQRPVETVAASSAPAENGDPPPKKRARPSRLLVSKLSRSRVTESRSTEKPPCRPDEDAEALFQGTREFAPTEVLAQHAWTVALQAQPAGTMLRLRFAARAVDVPMVSIRLRYSDDVQRTLRFQLDFQKGTLRRAGGRLDAEVRAAGISALDGGWLLCEFDVVVGRAEPLGLVLVFLDPANTSPWQMTGKPGQRLLIGAATVAARPAGGAAAEPAPAAPEESVPRVRVIRRPPPVAAEPPPPPTGLQMSERDRTMTPATVGGKAVTPSRWQKLAEQRLGHERSFVESDEWGKILAMKDIHKGKRAFILGNGPSINQQDLTLLRDEITFVANWFINHKRFRRINPKYYCVSSHEMFGGWGKTPELNADFARRVSEKQTEQTFFFSTRFAPYMRELGLVPDPRLRSLIFDRPKLMIDEIGTQNYELNRCMDDGYTVLLTFCVPLCVHFGITDIYLLGCDCDYGLTAPTDPKAYFYRPEQHTSATTSFDSLVRIWTPGGPIFQTYEIVAAEAQKRGTRMWNATRGGRLELLPRVDYESLVQG
jgi:hypothetical protein